MSKKPFDFEGAFVLVISTLFGACVILVVVGGCLVLFRILAECCWKH